LVFFKIKFVNPVRLNMDCWGDDDDDDDEGRINFIVALSPETTRTRNNKPKQ